MRYFNIMKIKSDLNIAEIDEHNFKCMKTLIILYLKLFEIINNF